MRPSVGVVPVIACLVLAVALGLWGWRDREATRDRVRVEREERDRRDAPIVVDDPMGLDPVILDACGRLYLAATLTPPSAVEESVSTTPGEPGETGVDQAREIVDLLDSRPDEGVPALEDPAVQEAIGRLRAELGQAVDRSDDPLSEPGVTAAAARLDGALTEVC